MTTWYAAVNGERIVTFKHPEGNTVRVFDEPADGLTAFEPLAFLQKVKAQPDIHVILFDRERRLASRASMIPDGPLDSMDDTPGAVEHRQFLERLAREREHDRLHPRPPPPPPRPCPGCDNGELPDGGICRSCGYR